MKIISSKITKKIIILILNIAVLIALLCPQVIIYKDGGSKRFRALLYEVYIQHKMKTVDEDEYYGGVQVKILGFEIYNSLEE